MLDSLVPAINNWIQMAGATALAASFLWGVVSVLFSPCHLASIPLLIAYVGGQQKILTPKEAARYAVLFAAGLFISIVAVGVVCAALGRMMGDVGPWWQIAVGVLLIWVGLGMFGVTSCNFGGANFTRWQIRGLPGALILGLAYGLLSGVCTFGFIAPILGIITLQQKIATGVLMIILFAAGHCLPLVAAGTFSAAVRNTLASHAWQRAADLFRRTASIVIIGLGMYFIAGALYP